MAVIRDLLEYLRIDVRSAYKVAWNGKHDGTYGDITTPTLAGLTSSRNSAAVFTSKGFSTVLTWDRVDWQTFCQPNLNLVGGGLVVTASTVKTTRDLAKDLGLWLGIDNMPKDWVLDEAISLTAGGSVVFNANPARNLWWTGKLTIPLKTRCFTLTDGTVGSEFDFNPRPWHHPGAEGTITRPFYNAGLLTHGIDYSAQDAALFAIPQRTNRWAWTSVTAAQAAALAAALKAVDGLPWNANSGTVDFNLLYCSIIYNGPVEGAVPYVDSGFAYMDYPYFEAQKFLRKDKEFVLIANLNPNQGSNNLRYAPIIVHYGRTIPARVLEQPWKDPLHWWRFGPLDSWVDLEPVPDTTTVTNVDLSNSGSDPDSPTFPNVVTGYTTTGNKNTVRLNTAGAYALNKPLPFVGDYTISFLHLHPESSRSNHIMFFGDGVTTTGWVNGPFTNTTFNYWMQPFSGTNWTRSDGATGLYRNFSYVTFVVRDKRAYVYINGELVMCSFADSVVTDFIATHFGRGGAYNLPITHYLGEIAYFDYALNNQQVQKFLEGCLRNTYKVVCDVPAANTHAVLKQLGDQFLVKLTADSIVNTAIPEGISELVIEPTYKDPAFMTPRVVKFWNGAASKSSAQPYFHIGTPAGNRNLGTSLTEFTVGIDVDRSSIPHACSFNSSNGWEFGPGVAMRIAGTWNFSIELTPATIESGDVCLFTTDTETEALVAGDLILRDGRPVLVGYIDDSTVPALKAGESTTLRFFADQKNLYMLINGEVVTKTATIPAVTGLSWKGVGKQGTLVKRQSQSVRWRDLRYWVRPVDAPVAPVPQYHWIDDTGVLDNLGLGGVAPLTSDQFSVVTYLGKKYAAIAQPLFGKLPVALVRSTDFTLDVEIVASKVPNSNYGTIFTNAITSASGATGDIFTWREMVVGFDNVPAFTSIQYGSYSDCLWQPGFDDTPARLTIVKTGNTYDWYRNGVLKWSYTNTTALSALNYFGSSPKRTNQLFRNLRYYNRSLSVDERAALFSA